MKRRREDETFSHIIKESPPSPLTAGNKYLGGQNRVNCSEKWAAVP